MGISFKKLSSGIQKVKKDDKLVNSEEKSQIQLSQEEIRILRECNKESFYYRCLPLAIAGMAGTFLAVKNGYLKGHPKWGPAGKMTCAVFVGWFVGKFSYRYICEDKFLKLEHSAVGDAVRRKRGYSKETFDSEIGTQFPDEYPSLRDASDPLRNDDYHSSTGSLNLDVDKNVPYLGLDDRERPSTDREIFSYGEKDEAARKMTSYEELRRRNRDEYERQHHRQSQTITEPSQSTSNRPWGQTDTEQSNRFTAGKPEGRGRNAYGDSWDNPKFN